MTATKKLLYGMNKIIFNDTEDAKGMSPKAKNEDYMTLFSDHLN